MLAGGPQVMQSKCSQLVVESPRWHHGVPDAASFSLDGAVEVASDGLEQSQTGLRSPG